MGRACCSCWFISMPCTTTHLQMGVGLGTTLIWIRNKCWSWICVAWYTSKVWFYRNKSNSVWLVMYEIFYTSKHNPVFNQRYRWHNSDIFSTTISLHTQLEMIQDVHTIITFCKKSIMLKNREILPPWRSRLRFEGILNWLLEPTSRVFWNNIVYRA